VRVQRNGAQCTEFVAAGHRSYVHGEEVSCETSHALSSSKSRVLMTHLLDVTRSVLWLPAGTSGQCVNGGEYIKPAVLS
jgi:hypothetical protein